MGPSFVELLDVSDLFVLLCRKALLDVSDLWVHHWMYQIYWSILYRKALLDISDLLVHSL